MDRRPSRLLPWGIILLFLGMVSIPYLYASFAAGPEYVFGGFLLNPIDGNSYLAKMRQGYAGGWWFTLPYTAQPGEGSFLFLFYLFLGHLAKALNWSLLFTFHLVRLLGAALLALSLYRFCGEMFSSHRTRILAFSLASFGSGLGWLAFAFGAFTSDFWVAEAYPFLSAYANPHFAIGLAIQLWLLIPIAITNITWRYGIRCAIAAILLAEIAPFAIPVVIVINTGLLLWKLLNKENAKTEFIRLIWVALGSGPILAYDFWVINSHPVLSGWNAQNLTPSPPIWDLLISIAPAILLAILAARHIWKTHESSQRILLVWLVVCLVLLYLPFNLQRRFLNGFFVPVALLAALGVEQLASENTRRYRRYVIALFTLSLPTNLIILAMVLFAVQTHDLQIYLTDGEARAFSWIDDSLPEKSLILAGPDTGLYLPAYTHATVVYGHPFETLNAQHLEDAVIGFFSSWNEEQIINFIDDTQVNYLFIGPRERELGTLKLQENWQLVYENMSVTIYSVDK